MNELCFTTYVYGWYKDFIPIYIFSILHEFPQHFVKIYIHEELNYKQKQAIDLVSRFNSSFSVIASKFKWPHIKHLAAVRYLMPREEFSDFRYVYFGDVDFILVNEHNDNFINYYRNHCKRIGLPFSNAITHDNNKNRMTGLHFIETDPYYDRMEPQIADVVQGNEFSVKIQDSFSFDEEILYYMADRTFGLRPLEGYTRPHNGVHLGYSRERPTGHSYAHKTKLKDWKANIGKINSIVRHPVFKELQQLMDSPAKDVLQRVLHILHCPIFL